MDKMETLLLLYKKKRDGKLSAKEELEYEKLIGMQCFNENTIEAILEKMIKEEGLT